MLEYLYRKKFGSKIACALSRWLPKLFSNFSDEDRTECSETSAYKIQTPGNYPKENIQYTEHGESLKSIAPTRFGPFVRPSSGGS